MASTSDFPAAVRRYFTPPGADTLPAGPVIIAEEFTPGKGWFRPKWRKGITHTYARKLRRAGVTAVQLEHNGRRADFQIGELIPRREPVSR